MKLRNSFVRDDVRVFSEHGSPIKIKYAPRIDENGVLQLEEVGKENLDDYIQSFAESCDIHVIMSRYANGETDVLSKVQGTYGDFTGMPISLADMLNRVIAGENAFNQLPANVKKLFNNSFTEYAVATGNPEEFWAKIRSCVPDQKESIPEETPKGENE